jgi:nucleotide-binding universal stress UspA family protein
MEAARKRTHHSEVATGDKLRRAVARIAVGVDGYSEGRDAVTLGAAIARATGAELMLVAVHPDPLVVLPSEMNWKGLEKQAEATLREARDALAPGARIVVETDFSVPRALARVVRRERRDLLVMGSSRHAPEGLVRIGKRTRQLLCHFECALAVAPRGMHEHTEARIARMGVGYDGGPESQAALMLAGEIAVASAAELRVRGVVDARVPAVGWSRLGTGAVVDPTPGWSAIGGEGVTAEWDELVQARENSLRAELDDAARTTGARAKTEVVRGRPATALIELCRDIDLLVIGSRRWGAVARLMLGSTGEALLHDASCPVLVVPRPQR